MKQRMLAMGLAALVFASLGPHAADRNAVGATPTDSVDRIECRWLADEAVVAVSIGGQCRLTLEGFGPLPPGAAGRDAASPTVGRRAAQSPRTETVYRDADQAEWTVVSQPSADGGLTLAVSSSDPRFAAASPGRVLGTGAWIGLDLSQHALAHGQPHWPKTYYLPGVDLFLCAWWDLEASGASRPEWPESACEARRGTGPFAPAATMRYLAVPGGRQGAFRETLHLRVARRLWDAALPSLCEPSEYGQELTRLVYLDDWSGQSAVDLQHMLGVWRRLAWPHVGFLTIVQAWQAGGFDALLPDSIRMPDFPPSPAVGTLDELRAAAEAGKAIGRFGFRTNYMLLRTQAPSFVAGRVDFAMGPDGKPTWYTQPSRWSALAGAQEAELASLFAPTASFTDQLGSGGHPSSYLDFGRAGGGDGAAATALAHQRRLARLIKDTHHGPLGTETLNQQDLLGYYCDFGDFGVMGGHDRLFTPEYKLRRLQTTTVHYGCGLYYRFFELPPFPRFHRNQLDLWTDPALMDDYRCCEVMLGNGAYIFWPAPWDYALTEAILVGRLQSRFALVPVVSVEYQADGGWKSLEELVKTGFAPEIRPWNQKQEVLGRVRVVYANGLTVVVNRLPAELPVSLPAGPIVLPQYGWAVLEPRGALQAYSAYWPGTHQRVDFLDEGPGGLRFLHPRGHCLQGSTAIRLWSGPHLLWSVEPATGTATVEGQAFALNRPGPEPLGHVSFDFRADLGGWVPAAGVLRVEHGGAGVKLAVVSEDPQLNSPPLAFVGRPEDVLNLTLSADAGSCGQIYFATTDEGLSQRQGLQFALTGDGKPQTIAIPIGQHPGWAGHRVTRLRLDPIHGPAQATVVLYELEMLP